MRSVVQVRYSEAFKREVVEAVESGRFRTLWEARDHFGIRGESTVNRWLRQHGREHLLPRVVRVEKPGEADQIRQLKQRIAELEKALGQTHLENIMTDAYLRQACKALGTDLETFKKKQATKPCTKPASERAKQ